jgi:5-methylthioadenosine/S-adenosylhomocysteine deaminase
MADIARNRRDGESLDTRRRFLRKAGALGLAPAAALAAASCSHLETGAPPLARAMPARDKDYVIRGGYVITMDRSLGDIPVGDIHVRDGSIVAVGPAVSAPGAEVLDARGMIVMPGFVETHSHVWNALLRNLRRPGVEYFMLKNVFGKHHTPVDYYRANRLFLAEALDAGITTVLNYAHNTQSPAHVDAEVRAMLESGLRGRYAYGAPDPYPLDKPVDFADIARVKRQWFGQGAGDRFDARGLLELGYAYRAPFPAGSPPSRIYPLEFRWMRENGLPIIMHAGHAPRYLTPSALQAESFVERSMIFVHCPLFEQQDREIMARTGSSASISMYNDLSFRHQDDVAMRLQMNAMTAAGVNVCLSHDATSINPTSMFDQMRLAFHVSIRRPVAEHKAALTQLQCLEMATINGARAMGIEDKVGSLVPRKRADIIMLRAESLNLAPFHDGVSAVLHSANNGNVDTVIVDGRVLKSGGRMHGVNVAEIQREAQESFLLLRERAGGAWAPQAWEKRRS